MKKLILGLMMTSMFVITNIAIAMDKKEMPKTSLSVSEIAELRRAVVNYKKDRSRAKQEGIINQYQNQYPNDPFVKAKVNEKARFDNSQQSKVKEMPRVQQPVKKEIQINERSMKEKPNLRITNLYSKSIEVEVQYMSGTFARFC
jgi:hypothetical protein